MNEFIEKLISRLEKEEEYQLKKADECEQKQAFEMISVSKSRRKNAQCFDVAIQVVNQLAEEYNNESVKGDLISRSAVIRELNGIYLDNPYDDKEDILEKAIGIVDNFSAPYQPKGE